MLSLLFFIIYADTPLRLSLLLHSEGTAREVSLAKASIMRKYDAHNISTSPSHV